MCDRFDIASQCSSMCRSYWEGGVRGEAFIYSEGLLPAAVRGSAWSGLAHASDWYATIIEGAAGLQMPAHTGPISIDGHNLWEALRTGGPSPRTQVLIQAADPAVYNVTTAIRVGRLKAIVGAPGDSTVLALLPPPESPIPFGHSGGTVEPGTDHANGPGIKESTPSPRCKPACLFDVVADANETHDLAAEPSHASVLQSMLSTLTAATADAMPPQEIFQAGDNAAKAENAAQMAAICAQTGFLEPGDIIPPVPPPAPPAPPSPSPPSPGPTGACAKALAKVCPAKEFKTYDECLACTRKHDPPNCKPKERQAYCHAS